MDDLARFIVERVRYGFHPYIPQDESWRRYPPHVARVLKYIEPLHIIAITPAWVGVDDVYIADTRGMHSKYDVAIETVEAIFGETVEKAGGGNLELRALSTGFSALSFFQGSVWYVAVCADNRPYPSRLAFVADQQVPCARSKYASREGEVACVAATVDGAKVSFPASEKFFLNPEPENVELFGDLLFLAQMRSGWVVDKEVEVSVGCDWHIDPYEYLAFVLEGRPGAESLLKHAQMELVLGDQCEAWKWRSLAKAIEKRLKRREEEVEQYGQLI